MATPGPVDIFFSYPGGSPADSEHVLRLGEMLEKFGFSSWIAGRDRPPIDGDYPTANPIVGALESAPVFIACFGRHPAGGWGQTEIQRAVERSLSEPDFLLIGVILPGAQTPPPDGLPAKVEVHDLRDGVNAAPLVPALWRRLQPARARLLEEIVTACLDETQAVVLAGPAGSGKSALAQVATWRLSSEYPDGQAVLQYEERRGINGMAHLIMRTLRINLTDMRRGNAVTAYQQLLRDRRFLVVLDEADIDDATSLVPPPPSTAIFVALRPPRIAQHHRVFHIPSPSSADPQGGSQMPTAVTQPGYIADTPKGADLLSIQASVDALSSVIAAREVQPPLSVGLFGDWGAGKSFFIEKMRARIEAVSEAATKASDASCYCSSVKQISFNAWHYADANLWASLASRVFEGLAETEDGKDAKLIAQLESSRLQLADASTGQALATSRREQAENDLQVAREEVKETEIKLSDLSDSAPEILRESGRAEEADLLSLAGSARALWKRSKSLAAAAAAATLACLGVGLLAPGAYAWLAAGAAALAGTLGVALWPLRWVMHARDKAEQHADELRRRREAELASKAEASRQDERDAIRRREKAQRDVDEAKLEIAEIKDGRRLYRFIEERSRAEAYGEHLGIVSLVRQDFERLRELIAQQGKRTTGGPPPLERIVLYVDDLDRCPAFRVVEVLEAVHLLLASELFVVVVAVDPHWLIRSVQHRYAAQMPAAGNGYESGTPQDYLEKIFQIPFSLPPMDQDGYRQLIASLIPTEPRDPAATEAATAVLQLQASDSVVGTAGDTGPATVGDPVRSSNTAEDAPVEHPIDLRPEGLRVTEVELAFMSRLDSMVRTPRAAKRLTNLYRLVRVSLSEQDLALLLGHRGGQPQFPGMQLLLAITVGFPSLAPHLFDALPPQPPVRSWWDFIDEYVPLESHARPWGQLVAAMKPLQEERFLPDLGEVTRWVPQVSRFSYGLRAVDRDDGPPQ